ncbi:ferritin-like domain-containing protein [Actinocrinis sp.]|uniref:ferritin-like domain-containing protein n=1 Tax=Actinocrinis sp. TaxID=1920516 RepID=UPI002D266975|nr:ferritin-like domain-containing protein [Actinocrinis sp.]HZP53403.1 ferritin-like domain-containing protein [Actinocrinis sp.]
MITRRSLVTATAGAGAALPLGIGLSACGSPRPASVYTADARTFALAAAVENQLTDIYGAMLAALRAQKADPPAPAFTQFLITASAHHAEHAKSWNSLLRAAHKPEITGVPLAGHAALKDQVAGQTTAAALARLAGQLELQAARTHLAALSNLTDTPGISAAAGIAPIEAMHAAVVDCIMGGRPAPDDFLALGGALRVSELLA